jgi:predicted O-methyltransferase YrrM
MNSVLEDILKTGVISSPTGDLTVRDHISTEEGQFLHELVATTQPQRSLEVGLACGISALYICGALAPSARHIAIDPLQSELFENAGLIALEQAGFANRLDFYEEPSQFALPRLAQEGHRVGFAFIDGMHTFDHALLDFFYIDMLLERGGIVAFDDADIPAVRRVVRFAVTNRAYRVHSCLPGSGRRSPASAIGTGIARLPGTRRALRPDFVTSDQQLGIVLNSRCVALVKDGDDTRPWDFHVEF